MQLDLQYLDKIVQTTSSSWILPVPPGRQIFWKILTIAVSIRKPYMPAGFGFSSVVLNGHRHIPAGNSQRSIKQPTGVCKQPTRDRLECKNNDCFVLFCFWAVFTHFLSCSVTHRILVTFLFVFFFFFKCVIQIFLLKTVPSKQVFKG